MICVLSCTKEVYYVQLEKELQMSNVDQIEWEQIESSNVQQLYHRDGQNILCVRFNNGGLYSYAGCDHENYMNLRMSSSVGKYLNNVIKALPYTRWDSEEDLLAYLNS